MKKYTAFDFLNADINVTKIDQIWKAETKSWARPQKLPREFDGLLFFVSGAIHYDFGDFSFDATPGQVLKLPCGIPYSGRKLSNDLLTFYAIDFQTARSNEFLEFPLPLSFTPTDSEQVGNMFDTLTKTWRQSAPCNPLDCKRDFYSLLSFLTKDFANSTGKYDAKNRIFQITDFIEKNAHDPNFKIEDVARKFYISETHLRRIFEAEFGTSPISYLCAIRLENAKCMLLSKKDMNIRAIAEACGYASVYYFSNTFRKNVGISPSEYRRFGKE